MALSPKKGMAHLLSFLSIAALFSRNYRSRYQGTGRPAAFGRFNLSGLPPAWKGKVQRRKNRGGKKA